MEVIKELYEYREMIQSLVKRDLRGRYKGSVLGFLWTFLNPFCQMLVYTLVFSVIMRAGIEKYYLFLFVTLIPWTFFSSVLVSGSTCILFQKNLVQKIYFPRQVLPIVFTISQFINMLFSFIVVFVVLLLTRTGFNMAALYFLPFVMLVEFVFALGVTLIVSALTVFLRDLEYVFSIITMAWQFLSPVIYSVEQIPSELRGVFYLNPMTSILTAYRDILYYKQVPELSTLGIAIVVALVVFAIGWCVFSKLSKRFAEVL